MTRLTAQPSARLQTDRFRSTATGRLVSLLLVVLASGCGSTLSRRNQDWSTTDDARFARVCLVTNYGSGVCIARTGDGLYVLTNAHLVGADRFVDVFLYDLVDRRYRKLRARTLSRGHPNKCDLALLRVDRPPPGPRFSLGLAEPLGEGELRENVDVLTVYRVPRPTLFRGTLVQRTVLWAGSPDDYGATTYPAPMACVFGGIRSANSGTPVFHGEALIGIHAVSPFDATLSTGRRVVGIGILTTSLIRTFLERNGYDSLVAAGDP